VKIKRTVCLIGLAFTAVGSGGIKPCVSALGADQFILPQQEKQLASYFGIFYLTINLGSLLSTFIVPEISKRKAIHDTLQDPASESCLR